MTATSFDEWPIPARLGIWLAPDISHYCVLQDLTAARQADHLAAQLRPEGLRAGS